MIEKYFKTEASLQRRVRYKDGMGGATEEWLTIMTSKGVLDATGGHKTYYSDKVNADNTHVWICSPFELTIEDPADQAMYFGNPFSPSIYGSIIPAAVTEADRLLINDIPYRIVFIDDPMNFARHLEILVKRWDNG